VRTVLENWRFKNLCDMATLKTTEPDFFLNSENQGGFQNGKLFFKKMKKNQGDS
jgi:hypothetical protein